ncbi:MAG: 16S rRNA (uracil(1498)-N(3))-methyltransferase, partial [Desulfobulbaceae bacterium]|nr:16S rRNA (uracil(1498)-N(3))-methyltransferase [Desulfobulbaceae bacterium]
MNLILIEKQELTTDHTVVLTDHRGEHIKNVLRCSKNDEVRVGLVNGPTGSGRILDISPGQ